MDRRRWLVCCSSKLHIQLQVVPGSNGPDIWLPYLDVGGTYKNLLGLATSVTVISHMHDSRKMGD